MKYSEEQIEQLNNSFDDIKINFRERLSDSYKIVFEEKRANEFFKHGFFRRFSMLFHCIERVFEIYPPDRENLLVDEERYDLEAFIQTFVINLYGAIDNLAWIVNAENKLNLKKIEISLYNKEIQKCFPNEFVSYICNEGSRGFKKWYVQHCKVFRHSLGHRIPLYIPPSGVNDADRYQQIAIDRQNAILNHDFAKVAELNNEEKSLEHILPLYIHSFEENSPQVIIHSQLIVDFRTLLELYDNFIKYYV